jgi:DNA-damage-inducible protein J
MSETTFTLRVDARLKERFSKAAATRDRTPSQLLRDFMRQYAEQPANKPDYDAWLVSRVQAAMDDPRPAVPAAQAEARLTSIKAKARRKYGAPRGR